jgi:hypothetical protein
MCVIAIVETKRPTEYMVQRMWEQNSHGGGVAWREDGQVKWKKGLNLADMKQLAGALPLPYILHFRIASVGGAKKELTHPFAVDDFLQSSLALEGSTKGGVLFHNGHWNDWFGELLRTAALYREQVPTGVYSDTRAMAWMTSHYGQGFLDALDEKTVILTPDDLSVTVGGGWVEVEGVWCSNDYWDRRYSQPTMCKNRSCTISVGLDKDGFCWNHRILTVDSSPKVVQISGNTTSSTTPVTTATETANATGSSEVAPSETPFGLTEQLLQAELAWSLVDIGALSKDEARVVCSKQRLKHLRKMQMIEEKKAQKARKDAAVVSSSGGFMAPSSPTTH